MQIWKHYACQSQFQKVNNNISSNNLNKSFLEIEHSAPSGPPGPQGVVCLIPKVVLGISKKRAEIFFYPVHVHITVT